MRPLLTLILAFVPFCASALIIEESEATRDVLPTYIYECRDLALKAFTEKAIEINRPMRVGSLRLRKYAVDDLVRTTTLEWSITMSDDSSQIMSVITTKTRHLGCALQKLK